MERNNYSQTQKLKGFMSLLAWSKYDSNLSLSVVNILSQSLSKLNQRQKVYIHISVFVCIIHYFLLRIFICAYTYEIGRSRPEQNLYRVTFFENSQNE